MMNENMLLILMFKLKLNTNINVLVHVHFLLFARVVGRISLVFSKASIQSHIRLHAE